MRMYKVQPVIRNVQIGNRKIRRAVVGRMK